MIPAAPDPRSAEIDAFLDRSGWSGAGRRPLAGDASDRRYWRLSLAARRAVLMDTPAGAADDPAAFLRVAAHLASLGLSPPAVLAADADRGLILLEDLGDGLYDAHLRAHPGDEALLYLTATEVLATLQAAPPLAGIPDLSPAGWAETAGAAMGWYGAPALAGPVTGAVAAALQAHPRKIMVLRDFHAGNLIWLPGRPGPARAGLLDFQTAQTGLPAYDLVSLLQDARRDVAAATQAACLRRFCDLTGRTEADLSAECAAVGALRALRILGVFTRLAARGKPQYLAFRPRVWRDLQRNLLHPALADLAAACRDLPPP
jgi:aminoglycoside/choline kinase family phosphotransferase